MFLYTLYRFGRFAAVHLPLSVSYRLACICADCMYLASARDRRAVMSNLRTIRATADGRELRRMARAVFRNFAKYLVDFFRFSLMSKEYIDRYVTVHGKEHLAQAAASGKGVIVLSAHLGNWELGGSVISSLGFPLTGIALSHRHNRINDFFTEQRRAGGVTIIEIGASLRGAYAVLKNNGFLGLVGDRDFSRKGLAVPFFGRTTLMPKGPAAFSRKTGSPVVPVFIIRNPNDTFTVHIEPPMLPMHDMPEDEAITSMTNRCVAVIESYISQYPSQWFAFRDIWEEYERNDVRPYTVV